jgi:outer membrane protein
MSPAKPIFRVTLLGIFCSTLLLQSAVRSETLQEAYGLAQQNDSKFRAATADFRANGLAADQARAAYRPTAKFEFENTSTQQRILSSQNPIFGPGETSFPTTVQTLSITQAIYRKDLLERMSQSKVVVRQAELTFRAAEQDLQLRTTASYLVVLAARDSLALATAEREAVGKTLDLAREKLKMGLGTITVQHDATARFAVARAREIEAQNKLADAKQGLREITGTEIESLQSLRNELALEKPEPANVEPWLEAAVAQNIGLQAKSEAVEVARLEYERQRAGHFPSLNLLLNHTQRDAGSTLFGGGSNVETTDVTVRLTIPLYEGGLTTATTQEAVYRQQKAREDYEQERRAVERAIRAYFAGVSGGVELVQALNQSVVAQQSALQAKEEGFKSGLYTLLPVLDAQRDLFLAKRDYAQARYDYLLYRLRLKQAVGTLSDTDLSAIYAALE